MLPAWWNQTIVIYHRQVGVGGVTWQPHVSQNCFVQLKDISVNVDTARRDGNRLVCRIPIPVPVVALGDIVQLGAEIVEIDESVRGMTSADMMAANPDGTFIVSELHDNTNCPVPIKHIYIGGA